VQRTISVTNFRLPHRITHSRTLPPDSFELAFRRTLWLGITINSIAPGAIATPINKNLLNDPSKLNALLEHIPLKRLGRPEDVANMAVFLASEESNYATGTTFFVDGGLTWNYQEQ
jgi:NAD(P)-dependent dehydrogenase (short-subunit alcohol dehydrogenase family)